MSGSTKLKLGEHVLAASIATVACGLVAFMVVTLTPKKEEFAPMNLTCVDTQGEVAVQENSLRYTRDGNTLVGYDEDGYRHIYTPPLGWVCKYGEIKGAK